MGKLHSGVKVKARWVYRSAVTGRFVTEESASVSARLRFANR